MKFRQKSEFSEFAVQIFGEAILSRMTFFPARVQAFIPLLSAKWSNFSAGGAFARLPSFEPHTSDQYCLLQKLMWLTFRQR